MISVSWVGTISDEAHDNEPFAFSRERLERQRDLFAHRAALFHTPTPNLPEEYIGEGSLDITLPVVTPDFLEIFENPSLMRPRFWVDLIQRKTGKIRWTPNFPAKVKITRFDYYTIREDHLYAGIKALLDAFKLGTNGRTDGKALYYFGAIKDDDQKSIELNCSQVSVKSPRDCKMKIRIEPNQPVDTTPAKRSAHGLRVSL